MQAIFRYNCFASSNISISATVAMTMTTPIRILYVGRNSRVAESLKALFSANKTLPSVDADGRTCGETDDTDYRLLFSSVSNQKAALEQVRTKPPSVILVETDAKPNSRARFLEMIRYRLPTAAVLAISRTEPVNRESFDGFVSVPLQAEETMAKIHHICHECNDYQIQRGSVLLNVATRTVSTPNGRYRMTPKQCALLQMLMLHHNRVVQRADIMESIWETSFLGDTRTLDVHVRWLRERIEPEPSAPIYLVTVRGVGYRLNLEV
jgi:DNA-binding response OmpR family regulator